jgi:hypothetical protein
MYKVRLPLGPWSTEPDEKHWVDAATGLHCYVKRHPEMGHLCGYVGVPPSHPTYKLNYDKLTLSAHGGITHANSIEDSPMPDLWWIGFDCAHAFDLSPGLANAFTRYKPTGKYRDMEYVTRECTLLASQLKDYVPPMSLHEALTIVVRTAEVVCECKPYVELEEACALVREHIESLED